MVQKYWCSQVEIIFQLQSFQIDLSQVLAHGCAHRAVHLAQHLVRSASGFCDSCREGVGSCLPLLPQGCILSASV